MIIALVLLVIGTTYAVFEFIEGSTATNSIETGNISMTYTEPTNALILENALPMSDEEGKAQSNYFEFSVTSHATTNASDNSGIDLSYEINISELPTDADKEQIYVYNISVYLTKVVDDTETKLIEPTSLIDISSSKLRENARKIYNQTDTHKNGNEEVTTTYRLRAWIDSDSNLDFSTKTYQYKFSVNVNSVTAAIGKGNLSMDWKYNAAVETLSDYDAILTFDKKALPETYTFDGKEYRKTGEVDVSEQENGSVIFGHYEGEEITDSNGYTKKPILGILGQNGGVVAPDSCAYLFTNAFTISGETIYLMPKYLDITHLDTSNTTNMDSMFKSYDSLTVVGLTSLDTSNVINMSEMFSSYMGTSLDLSSFNTSKVTDMCYMFDGCSNLTSLDLSSFNTSNVTDMYGMFGGCSSLTSLDLTSFDTRKVTDYYDILLVRNYETNSHKLTSVSVGCNWTIPKDELPTGITDYTKVCNP